MRTWAWTLLLLAACEEKDVDRDDTDAVDTDTDAGDTDTDTDTDAAVDCASRTGGGLVTFDVVGQSFTGWFTDDAFLDAAIDHLAAGTTQVPVFEVVLEGADCDAQWSFHVDPARVAFADLTIELCDGTPEYVDENLASWIDEVGSWCPWSAVVTAVDDRR